MKVLISWSGAKSNIVATAMRQWIPDVIQTIEPWMSQTDIDAGARWNRDIEKELSETRFGIICLTKSNLTAAWILFESGALAKTIEGTFVCPYLIDLTPAEIPSGPLTQFQAKRANEKETWELICTINKALGDNSLPEERLRRTFERCWPDLKNTLDNLPTKEDSQGAERPVNDMVEEILNLVRGLSRRSSRGKRRAIDHAPLRSFSKSVMELMEREGYKCKLCGSEDCLEIEHIKSIREGGSDEVSNLRFICMKCIHKRSHGDES